MPTEVDCPKCGAKLRGPIDLAGKTVRCKNCQERFRVPGGASNAPGDPGESQQLSAMDIPPQKPMAKPVVKSKPKMAAIPADDTPAPPANAFTFGDSAPPDDDEEDEDEQPKKKSKKDKSESKLVGRKKDEPKKSMLPLLILGGVALFFLLASGGFAVYWFGIRKPEIAKAPASKAEPKPEATKAEPPKKGGPKEPKTSPSGTETPTAQNPKVKPTPGDGGPKRPVMRSGPPLPKEPPTEPVLLSKAKKPFAIDTAAEKIKAVKIATESRRAFVLTAGLGSFDTVYLYGGDGGAKEGSFDVKGTGAKALRPFEPSPDGKHLLIEGPPGKLNLYSCGDSKFLLEGVDPFEGKAERKGPITGLTWKGSDTFYVSDAVGQTDEWSLRDGSAVHTKPWQDLPPYMGDAPVFVEPLDEKDNILVVFRGAEYHILQRGKHVTSGTLPDGGATAVAAVGTALGGGVRMGVVATFKDTPQSVLYLIKFGRGTDKPDPPVAVPLPDNLGPIKGIGWQKIETIVVSVENGAAALLVDIDDLEGEAPAVVGYVKHPTEKAHFAGKAPFNGFWYALGEEGKTKLFDINLDFNDYQNFRGLARQKPAKVLWVLPQENGLAMQKFLGD